MTKNILKSKLAKPLKYKAKLQFSIKDKNDSESSHNPKVDSLSLSPQPQISSLLRFGYFYILVKSDRVFTNSHNYDKMYKVK